MRNSSCEGIFRNAYSSTLKIQTNNDSIELKFLVRLCTGVSYLRERRFKHNFNNAYCTKNEVLN